MAVLPFGLWDVGESFNEAIDFEEEEHEQYEVEDITKRTQFQFVNYDKGQTRLSAETLVVACENAANAALKTYFNLPKTPVAEVCVCAPDNTTSKKSKRKETCYIYKLSDSLLCSCKLFISAQDCSFWVEEVMKSVDIKKVCILSSSSKTAFQGSNEVQHSDMDVLRYLKTSSCDIKPTNVKELEYGNMLQNLPAAALSFCEKFDIPAMLYVNFTASHYIDTFSLKTYEDAVNDEFLKSIPKAPSETISHRLKMFAGIGVADKNLYI